MAEYASSDIFGEVTSNQHRIAARGIPETLSKHWQQGPPQPPPPASLPSSAYARHGNSELRGHLVGGPPGASGLPDSGAGSGAGSCTPLPPAGHLAVDRCANQLSGTIPSWRMWRCTAARAIARTSSASAAAAFGPSTGGCAAVPLQHCQCSCSCRGACTEAHCSDGLVAGRTAKDGREGAAAQLDAIVVGEERGGGEAAGSTGEQLPAPLTVSLHCTTRTSAACSCMMGVRQIGQDACSAYAATQPRSRSRQKLWPQGIDVGSAHESVQTAHGKRRGRGRGQAAAARRTAAASRRESRCSAP